MNKLNHSEYITPRVPNPNKLTDLALNVLWSWVANNLGRKTKKDHGGWEANKSWWTSPEFIEFADGMAKVFNGVARDSLIMCINFGVHEVKSIASDGGSDFYIRNRYFARKYGINYIPKQMMMEY